MLFFFLKEDLGRRTKISRKKGCDFTKTCYERGNEENEPKTHIKTFRT